MSKQERKSKCPLCKTQSVVAVVASPPYSIEHLQCEKCDSTFANYKAMNAVREHVARKEGRWASSKYVPGSKTWVMRKMRYGISEQDFQEMFGDGFCPLCGRKMVHAHVDHNHKTGKVRGVLCARCNNVVGIIENRLPNLTGILDWVNEKHPQNFAPK